MCDNFFNSSISSSFFVGLIYYPCLTDAYEQYKEIKNYRKYARIPNTCRHLKRQYEKEIEEKVVEKQTKK